MSPGINTNTTLPTNMLSLTQLENDVSQTTEGMTSPTLSAYDVGRTSAEEVLGGGTWMFEGTESVTDGWNVSNESTSFRIKDVDWYLQQKNDEFTMLVLPAIIFLGVLFLLGVLGNSLVLYVYNRKFHKGTIRWFVQALAIFDLLSCLVAIPGEIIDMRNNYTFGSSPMCKVLRTVSMFCTVASGMTLMVVAVERYKRICTPLRKQITPKGAQVIITVCTVTASIFAAPASIVYGPQTIPTEYPDIHGSDCSTADAFLGTPFPLVFSAFQFLLFVLGALALVVLYSLIGHKVYSHANFRRTGFSTGVNRRMSFIFNGSECSSPTTEDMVFAFPIRKNVVTVEDNSNTSHGNDPNDNNNDNNTKTREISSTTTAQKQDALKLPTSEHKHRGASVTEVSKETEKNSEAAKSDVVEPALANGKTVATGQGESGEKPPSPSINELPKSFDTFQRAARLGSRPNSSSRNSRHKSGDFSGLKCRYRRRSTQHTHSDVHRFLHRSESVNSGTRRTTLMLFLISLVYLLSFLPYLILMIVKVLDEESLSGRGGGWELAHNILLRSYFINSMANPIIYSFCSRTFKKECSKVLHCRCCRYPLFVY